MRLSPWYRPGTAAGARRGASASRRSIVVDSVTGVEVVGENDVNGGDVGSEVDVE